MASTDLVINWEAEDGYVSKSRPQKSVVDLDTLIAECETPDEVTDFIASWVYTDFENKVTPGISQSSIDAAIAAWEAGKQQQEEQADD